MKEVNEGVSMKELLENFFSKYHAITQKELKFNKNDYLNVCETAEGRYLLVFFQIQLIKYQLLESYSNIFEKILFEYYELNKNSIIKEYIQLQSQ